MAGTRAFSSGIWGNSTCSARSGSARGPGGCGSTRAAGLPLVDAELGLELSLAAVEVDHGVSPTETPRRARTASWTTSWMARWSRRTSWAVRLSDSPVPAQPAGPEDLVAVDRPDPGHEGWIDRAGSAAVRAWPPGWLRGPAGHGVGQRVDGAAPAVGQLGQLVLPGEEQLAGLPGQGPAGRRRRS